MTKFEKVRSINKMKKLAKRIDQIIDEMKMRELNLKGSLRKAA
ncbi:hypothetical protein [Gilliamella sp.]|nr:hypothetical protein [Gilliamella sp.]